MLQTVEGTIDINAQIHWLKPLRVAKPSRVLILVTEHQQKDTFGTQ